MSAWSLYLRRVGTGEQRLGVNSVFVVSTDDNGETKQE